MKLCNKIYNNFINYLSSNKISPSIDKIDPIFNNHILNSSDSLSSLTSIKEYIHILIVDDSIVFSKILKYQLEKENYLVDTITNVEDAYFLLKNNIFSYDIFIIDIFMPYIYGTILIKKIRNEMNDNTPIIVLSSIPEFGQESLDLGANLFFEKGYPIDNLKNNIVNLLNK